jgi:hypothetical protein
MSPSAARRRLRIEEDANRFIAKIEGMAAHQQQAGGESPAPRQK